MTNGAFHSLGVMDESGGIERTRAVNYGCIHRVTTAPMGFPTNVLDYAFDDAGAAITIP